MPSSINGREVVFLSDGVEWIETRNGDGQLVARHEAPINMTHLMDEIFVTRHWRGDTYENVDHHGAEATRYEDEHRAEATSGVALHAPGPGAPVDYVRLVSIATDTEIGYWCSDEWEESGEEALVLGAIFGSLAPLTEIRRIG